jgi:hypothetical protein
MLAVAVTTGASADALSGPHVIAAIADYRDVTPAAIVAAAQSRRRLVRTGTDA